MSDSRALAMAVLMACLNSVGVHRAILLTFPREAGLICSWPENGKCGVLIEALQILSQFAFKNGTLFLLAPL